jgi:serine/threonine protein kinase
MPITSTVDLVDLLRRHPLLGPDQLNEITSCLQTQFPEPRDLARELVRRGWLTPFQVNQLLQGRGDALLLGSYVLLEKLGEGGMGAVYKARNWKLGRVVALKVIRKERLNNETIIRRFRREIEAAAQLSHPNIAHAYDADEVAGTHFFVMEYVEGRNLAQVVKERGPLPVAEACEYIRQAALGLQHAHERGLVHRDIKPSNLLLAVSRPPQPLSSGRETASGGTIKVLDMGLARLERTAGEHSSTLTQEGTVMGTPDYIAPEQALDSHRADIRADLYSLGCTLYYLFTGKAPFPGGSLSEKLLKHQLQEPWPVEELRPEVPPAVAQLVRKLMAKRPEQRHQTPAELAAALEALLAHRGGSRQTSGDSDGTLASSATDRVTHLPANPFSDIDMPGSETLVVGQTPPEKSATPRRRRLIVVAGVAGAVLAGVIGLALLLIGRKEPPADGDNNERETKTERPSPLDQLDPKKLPRDCIDYWRAAGREPPGELVGVLGEHRRRHWGAIRCVAYSPAAKLVASAGDDRRIVLWDAETMRPRAVLSGHTASVCCLAFSPNGKLLASGAGAGEGHEGSHSVRLWDVRTHKELPSLPHGSRLACLAFSPDGQRLIVGGLDHLISLWDVKTWKELPSITVDGRAPGGNPNHVWSLAFSPDGRRLLTGSHDSSVRVWDTQSRKQLQRFDGVSPYGVGFTQDGQLFFNGRLWDADTRKELHRFGDGALLCGEGRFVLHNGKLYQAATRKELIRLDGY